MSDPTQPADPPPPVQRRPFGELCAMLKAADDDMLGFEVDLDALALELRDRVDDIVFFTDRCYERAATLGARAKELAAKAAAFKNKADRLYDYVAVSMHNTEAAELPGVDYRFLRSYSERCEPVAEPTATTYLRLGKQAPDLIERTYTWKLAPLKKLLKADDATAKAYAAITRHPQVNAKPKV